MYGYSCSNPKDRNVYGYSYSNHTVRIFSSCSNLKDRNLFRF